MALHFKPEKAAAAMVSMGRRSLSVSGSSLTFSDFGLQTFRGIGRCKCEHRFIRSFSSQFVVRRMVSQAADTGGSSLSSFHEDEHFNHNKSNDITQPPSPCSSPVKVSMDELLALASCHPTPLSLADMYRYGSRPSTSSKDGRKDQDQFVDVVRLRNAQFLHRELPIRIAQRAIDLLTLPHGLNRTREVQSVANTYLQYLQSMRDIPVPTNAKTEREFTNALKNFILDRHSIPMAIARGLKSLKDERKAPVDGRRLAEMEEALNRFFTARVGLRFLVEHHVLSGNDENSDALYKQQLELEGGLELLEDETYASDMWEKSESCGCIQQNCDPIKEVKRTVARVTKLCRESYGIAPEINIVDCATDNNAKMSFTYVPHHLRYMLAELLKNSCRATVRSYLSGGNSHKEDHTKHHNDPDGGIHDSPTLPPIKVVVTKGSEDVTIKIADQGGGMPRSVSKHIWSFSHSTLSKEVRSREEKYEFGKDDFTGGHIRGFGLPLARIYARYFGGEVTIKSMEGYGVDAYLYLPVLGVACENLPQRVVRSPGNLDSSMTGSKQIFDGDGYYNGEVSDEYWTDGSSRNDDFFQDSASTRRSSAVLSNLNDRAL
ncbi:hypothetical protein ACHAW6_002098 [Cyclotella cf. meneghiniana]